VPGRFGSIRHDTPDQGGERSRGESDLPQREAKHGTDEARQPRAFPEEEREEEQAEPIEEAQIAIAGVALERLATTS
jgi:hypothetical protein